MSNGNQLRETGGVGSFQSVNRPPIYGLFGTRRFPARRRRRKCVAESLEPRLLLSSTTSPDILPDATGNDDPAPTDGDWSVDSPPFALDDLVGYPDETTGSIVIDVLANDSESTTIIAVERVDAHGTAVSDASGFVIIYTPPTLPALDLEWGGDRDPFGPTSRPQTIGVGETGFPAAVEVFRYTIADATGATATAILQVQHSKGRWKATLLTTTAAAAGIDGKAGYRAKIEQRFGYNLQIIEVENNTQLWQKNVVSREYLFVREDDSVNRAKAAPTILADVRQITGAGVEDPRGKISATDTLSWDPLLTFATKEEKQEAAQNGQNFPASVAFMLESVVKKLGANMRQVNLVVPDKQPFRLDPAQEAILDQMDERIDVLEASTAYIFVDPAAVNQLHATGRLADVDFDKISNLVKQFSGRTLAEHTKPYECLIIDGLFNPTDKKNNRKVKLESPE